MTTDASHLCLFDLDGTLLPIDSDHCFGEFLVAQGWADAEAFRRRNDSFFADYQAGTLDVDAYIEFATAAWRERPATEAEALRQRFMREIIAPHLQPQAHALVRRHQAAGDLVAIVTATNEFVTAPIAQAFGVPDLIATRLQRGADGRINGRIQGVPSFREGKIERVHEWLASLGRRLLQFERVHVYSDSPNDLPLLEMATDPVATNPSAALERTARERGWPILHLFT
jgi:HAD superfamily hydrolase (TIGR01490 family)